MDNLFRRQTSQTTPSKMRPRGQSTLYVHLCLANLAKFIPQKEHAHKQKNHGIFLPLNLFAQQAA